MLSLTQDPITIWFTGLPGSGKSTLARELQRKLLAAGRACFVLDGDNVRTGLCGDLGFSANDRHENLRRIAEVAKLFHDAGLIAIAAAISPYHRDRSIARQIIGTARFREVYLSASINVCEARDPKGHYRRARAGEISEFTGVSAPYEIPENPDLTLDTATANVAHCADILFRAVMDETKPRLRRSKRLFTK